MSIAADLKSPPGLVLSSVTPKHVRELLEWVSDLGTLAIQTVKTQLENHETRQKRRAQEAMESKMPSLFDSAAERLAQSLEEVPEDEMVSMESLPPHVLSRVMWRLENIPYYIFCRAKRLVEEGGDIDEWILRNEIWLREFSATSEQEFAPASKYARLEDSKTVKHNAHSTGWSRGLVRLSAHADVVFADSIVSETCRTITRPENLSGFKVLDGRRSATVKIQPSVEMFAKTFETMTGGLLKGLDWDHIFVAGGIVLGSLLCTNDEDATNTPDQWASSDIDLYIHGLGPVKANEKIEYIFSVFKANLPKDAPVLVVRNSKTITFFSQYPLRRIQVVLKLVKSPKDVILNFDLDICAIGWDGTEVYMLPRAARALETGYTVFTMDLINGHYLGDRRATQEQRVFKYADKGYGIRILQSYLDQGHPQQYLEELLEDQRKWMTLAMKWFKLYSEEHRSRWGSVSTEEYVITVSHDMLQEHNQITEDPPRRSVLSGFSLFMRNVILWEYELAGLVRIERDAWAAPVYDHFYYTRLFGVSYNDLPDYTWDESFNIGNFITSIERFNTECDLVDDNGDEFDPLADHAHDVNDHASKKYTKTQRITHASSVHEILQIEHDINLGVWLPKPFIEFAETLVPNTVRASGLPSYSINIFQPVKGDPLSPEDVPEDLQLVIWRITSITMWQQLHRAIDEVHEVLWSFYHAYAGLGVNLEREDRLKMLVSQLTRRAIRMTAQDEFQEFATWVARRPEATPALSHDVSESGLVKYYESLDDLR